jgi:hypothetical protein
VLHDYERRDRLAAPIVRAVLSRLVGWRLLVRHRQGTRTGATIVSGTESCAIPPYRTCWAQHQ